MPPSPHPNSLALALARAIRLARARARALRAELDRPGHCPADDPDSLITALAIVIAAQAPPSCTCGTPQPHA